MPGRPDFSQAGSDGGSQRMAVQEYPSYDGVNADQTTTVASGASEEVEIYAPTGSYYRVKGLYLSAKPDGNALSGDHSFIVYQASPGTGPRVNALQGKSSYNNRVYYVNAHWKTADLTAQPPDGGAQERRVSALRATGNAPIVIRYTNNTDVVYDMDRWIRLIFEEVTG